MSSLPEPARPDLVLVAASISFAEVCGREDNGNIFARWSDGRYEMDGWLVRRRALPVSAGLSYDDRGSAPRRSTCLERPLNASAEWFRMRNNFGR